MAKVLIVYYSRSDNTKKMAEVVEEGVKQEGVEPILKRVEETKLEDLLEVDGIIAGSPTYFGLPAAELKKFFDDSVKYYGKLTGKVGGAFTSSGVLGGGNETTIMAILEIFLIHGMIVQGTTGPSHYGAVAIGRPDEKAQEVCRNLGKRVAQLVKKLY